MHKLIIFLRKTGSALWRTLARYWRVSVWHKVLVIGVSCLVILVSVFYGVGQWYVASQRHKPYVMGVSFIPSYAQSLGLDPQQTMDALIGDVGVRNFRLVSYWNELEPSPGRYDFSSLDWQFKKAEAKQAKITLSIGLRQPRWPECHAPSWTTHEPASLWRTQLNDFMTQVVQRYRQSPALVSYQLENEALLKSFGTCTDFNRERLVTEYNLVKSLDSRHPIIMSRSDNLPTLPLGQPRPDMFGFSIYRRVWDATYTHRYVEYPFPAWYYASLAGMQKLVTGRDSMIHELQAEPWPPNGKGMADISLAEQNKSFNAQRFKGRISFAKSTGMHDIYLWGGEYWYYRLVIEHDSSVWNVAKTTYRNQ